MYAKALSGYMVVRGISSNICLDLRQRLDALHVTKQPDSNSEPSLSQEGHNSSINNKLEKRVGGFKKLI